MKTLVLMRHAEANWSGRSSDFDRPLNERGNLSSQALGNWLRTNNILPDLALVSAAKRTVETFNELNLNCPLEKKKKLYLAPSEEIFHQVRQVSVHKLLLICHNPGISEFSQEILSTWPAHYQFENFPPGSTCIINFDLQDWSELKFGIGSISNFLIPKDLQMI
tara:strand:+ start:705 stop:1196 length:492 start_codon:yes stop_codon:yes gene_type:complete